MQSSFGTLGLFDSYEAQQAEKKRKERKEKAEIELLEALRIAVAEITVKELSYRLDVSASLLSDALAERSCKGVRAAWLITIVEMASEANAIAVSNAVLGLRRALEVVKCKPSLTPEQIAERCHEKLQSMGPVGVQLWKEITGG